MFTLDYITNTYFLASNTFRVHDRQFQIENRNSANVGRKCCFIEALLSPHYCFIERKLLLHLMLHAIELNDNTLPYIVSLLNT